MVEKGVLNFAEDAVEVGVDAVIDFVLDVVEHLVDLVDGALALLLHLGGHLVDLHHLQHLLLLQHALRPPPVVLLNALPAPVA